MHCIHTGRSVNTCFETTSADELPYAETHAEGQAFITETHLAPSLCLAYKKCVWWGWGGIAVLLCWCFRLIAQQFTHQQSIARCTYGTAERHDVYGVCPETDHPPPSSSVHAWEGERIPVLSSHSWVEFSSSHAIDSPTVHGFMLCACTLLHGSRRPTELVDKILISLHLCVRPALIWAAV